MQLKRKEEMQKTPKTLKTKLIKDDIVLEVCKNYTYEFKEEIEFKKHELPKELLPEDFSIGIIIGSSGSGKSVLLNDMTDIIKNPKFSEDKAICSHFESYKDAEERLQGAGLNSIPSWLKPFNTLSNGQQYRANLALELKSNIGIDEFTSVIDRGTALGLSNSIQKYIRTKGLKNIIFASVHKDIVQYLNPDWVYDTDNEELTLNSTIYDLSIEGNPSIQYNTKKHFMEV